MFKRVDKFLVITTKNLMAMEIITQWIYRVLKAAYFIELEKFPSMIIYRIYIDIDNDWDKKIEKGIIDELDARHINIWGELT